jgi:hypothetical protein
MATEDDGVWRDESRTPLADLSRAMATYSADGQVDDPTGGEVGPELEFGDGSAIGAGESLPGDDTDPTSEEGRRQRPSPEGRTGPV